MKNFLLLIYIFVFWILTFGFAEAAVLHFEPSDGAYRQGDIFLVNARIDTEGEYINAVEGFVDFSADLLLFADAKDGNSIINLWIERPALKTQEKVIFSGIVPGGYNGKGLLFSLVFKANKGGTGLIKFSNVRALKNDGLGTAAESAISNFQFSISKQTDGKVRLPEIIDYEPPESFRPEIIRDPNVFEGKLFLVFATQDKGSGVDRYEVREGLFGEFVRARSPYLLQNQNLDKKILVKAVDKAGNKRVEALYPSNYKSWYQNYWILGIMILATVMYLIGKILWKKLNHK